MIALPRNIHRLAADFINKSISGDTLFTTSKDNTKYHFVDTPKTIGWTECSDKNGDTAVDFSAFIFKRYYGWSKDRQTKEYGLTVLQGRPRSHMEKCSNLLCSTCFMLRLNVLRDVFFWSIPCSNKKEFATWAEHTGSMEHFTPTVLTFPTSR